MKTVQGAAQGTVAVWLVCVMAGASCAVFYTHSRDNNYPRIGRRAFFTLGDKGSRYPRIGRSSPGSQTQDAMTGSDAGFRSSAKRSEFGVGRQEELSGLELSAPSAPADVMTSLEDQDEDVQIPLGLLFFSFDKNGDKRLTREEFVQGLLSAREMGTVCR